MILHPGYNIPGGITLSVNSTYAYSCCNIIDLIYQIQDIAEYYSSTHNDINLGQISPLCLEVLDTHKRILH